MLLLKTVFITFRTKHMKYELRYAFSIEGKIKKHAIFYKRSILEWSHALISGVACTWHKYDWVNKFKINLTNCVFQEFSTKLPKSSKLPS